jgi:hypothetical protein
LSEEFEENHEEGTSVQRQSFVAEIVIGCRPVTENEGQPVQILN